MNKFLVATFCLALSLCSARPDVSLGYHYNAGYDSGANTLTAPSQHEVNFGGSDSSASGINTFALGSQSVPTFGNQQQIGQTVSSQYVQSGSKSVQFQQQRTQFESPIVNKYFYVLSAPEDHDEIEANRHITIGRPQKNFRVIFINAPTSSANRAHITADVAPVEDKTVIYVLSKKDNELEISSDVVTPAPTEPSKPEVFFIKYKTPEEATHAQHQIQAQYDALGGSTQFINQGVAPVSSVIGSLGGGDSTVTQGQQSQTYNSVVGQNIPQQSKVYTSNNQQTYLPPNNRY